MAKRRKGPGQPAKGEGGERVNDEYSILLVRIPPRTKRMLEGLSVLRRVPQRALVDEAIRSYVARLPEDERRRVERSRGRRGLRQFKGQQ